MDAFMLRGYAVGLIGVWKTHFNAPWNTLTSLIPSHLIMRDYKEPLPEGCPPSDAVEIEQIAFYRLIESFPPTDKDFLSQKALNPEKNYQKACIARGVSVFVGLRGIIDVSKLPTQQGKQIARLNLTAPAGQHRQTGPRHDHHSWWIYKEFDPAVHCRSELVSES